MRVDCALLLIEIPVFVRTSIQPLEKALLGTTFTVPAAEPPVAPRVTDPRTSVWSVDVPENWRKPVLRTEKTAAAAQTEGCGEDGGHRNPHSELVEATCSSRPTVRNAIGSPKGL